MTRAQRMLNLAGKIAAQERIYEVKYFLGAVVAMGNRPIAFGMNTSKSNPNNPKLEIKDYFTHVCAEVNAIQSALKFISREDLTKCDIYVARLKEDFKVYGSSKPCKYCKQYMKDLGIKRVFYIEVKGKLSKIKQMKL